MSKDQQEIVIITSGDDYIVIEIQSKNIETDYSSIKITAETARVIYAAIKSAVKLVEAKTQYGPGDTEPHHTNFRVRIDEDGTG